MKTVGFGLLIVLGMIGASCIGTSPVAPDLDVVVTEGQVLSGELLCQSFLVPDSVTAWVEEDFDLHVRGDLTIQGTLRAVDRNTASRHAAAPAIRLRAQRFYLAPEGALLGGRGFHHGADSEPLGAPGGAGSSLFVDAHTFHILGDVRGGDGGQGARGGRGGDGGSVQVSGEPASHPKAPANANPGQVRGGDGGKGGAGYASGSTVLDAGDGGSGGSVAFLPRPTPEAPKGPWSPADLGTDD